PKGRTVAAATPQRVGNESPLIFHHRDHGDHEVFEQRMLKLARLPLRSLLPSQLYLDHSHCLVLAPATLAALPSTRAIRRSRRVLCRSTPFARFSATSVSSAVKIFRFAISEIVFTCNDSFVSAQEPSDKDRTSTDSAENSAFNGAELSESVLEREWNAPEEDAGWSNL